LALSHAVLTLFAKSDGQPGATHET